MLKILVSLLCGVLIGFFWRNSPEKIKRTNIITLTGLFFLLMVMGAQLGSNKEILSGIGKMGREAIIIATLSIAGSIFLVQLASRFIQNNPGKTPQKSTGGAGAED